MIDTMLSLMEETGHDLVGHGFRVSQIAVELAGHLGLSSSQSDRLRLAGILHDLGKVEIDPRIIAKPGPLSEAEWSVVRRHPEIGFRMVYGLLHSEIAQTVLAHHERYDGGGYPHGRVGRDIPLLSRVLLVADAYDAITSDRPYQPALPTEYALGELRHHAGTQFDPAVVEAMCDLIGRARRSVA